MQAKRLAEVRKPTVAVPRERSPRAIVDGIEIVELRVRTLDELFHPLDPSPIARRDLSETAADYLYTELRDVSGDFGVRVVVHLPDAEMAHADAVVAAIRRHFAWSAVATRQAMHRLRRLGLLSLAIGLLAVAGLIGVAQLLVRSYERTFVSTLAESITIIAWVILWRPVEVLLFDWWPLRTDIALYERLAALDIECRAASQGSPAA
ncbi:MAG: hypothetical protein JNM94_00335 [Phycisphaerae bacterium]|nr:hypothetical protein [Phycisphaerae bacterium]